MGIFLNSIAPCEKYRAVASDFYFVDKSSLLKELVSVLGTERKYICITRPRRFGKTVMANMIAAFFGRAEDSSDVFETLEIGKSSVYEKHRNQYDVITIDFSDVPGNCDSYEKYIARIQNELYQDLAEAYPELHLSSEKAIWDNLSEIFERKKKQKFIFIMDEWDAVFHMSFITENEKKEYLLFLKSLLKSKAYVELAYMTGILPIAKYSSGSELNMFAEYDMATKIRFGEYFGFSEEEADILYERYRSVTETIRITREELREWYDGYHTAAGGRMYNPRSVVCALTDNQLANYWTSSGPYDEIFYYIRNNLSAVRDDLALMVAGEGVPAKVQEFSVSDMNLKTKNQIYSAMVVYGLLTFEDGKVNIPNKELMLKYEELLQNESSFGYIYRLAKASEEMLKATLTGDTDTMAEILSYAHNTESPIFAYNNEIELSAVVNLVYLSARDRYRIEREDKAGKGYVDFIFYPKKMGEDGIILELKVNHTPQEAIEQIKERQYVLRFRGKLGEQQEYCGRILAVGISYDEKKKEHFCKVEILEG